MRGIGGSLKKAFMRGRFTSHYTGLVTQWGPKKMITEPALKTEASLCHPLVIGIRIDQPIGVIGR